MGSTKVHCSGFAASEDQRLWYNLGEQPTPWFVPPVCTPQSSPCGRRGLCAGRRPSSEMRSIIALRIQGWLGPHQSVRRSALTNCVPWLAPFQLRRLLCHQTPSKESIWCKNVSAMEKRGCSCPGVSAKLLALHSQSNESPKLFRGMNTTTRGPCSV